MANLGGGPGWPNIKRPSALPAASPIAPPEENERRAPSNTRFRSFCERYLVTRSEFFRKDPDGLAEDTWQAVLDARRAYKMIRQVGYGIGNDD